MVRAWLAQKKLNFPELVLDNGSGLSREARISAQHMAQLLIAAWRSPMMPELMSSLPLVASDGTMRRRLRFEPIAGQAHIKTGSLDDVRALAGYVLDNRGRLPRGGFIHQPPQCRSQPAGAGRPARLGVPG